MKVLKNKIGLIITALIFITVTFFSTYSISSASALSSFGNGYFSFSQVNELPNGLVSLDESHKGVSFDCVKIFYNKDETGFAYVYLVDYCIRFENNWVFIYHIDDKENSIFSFITCHQMDDTNGFGYFYVNNTWNLYHENITFDKVETSGNIELFVDRTVGHTFEYVEEVAPTCQQSGVAAHYTCSHCDKTFDLEYYESTNFEIPMLPTHVYTWIDEKPATVNSVGIKGHYVCQYCDLTFDKDYLQITDLTIPKLELQTTNSGLSLANAIALYAGLHLIVFVIALVVAKISKKRK